MAQYCNVLVLHQNIYAGGSSSGPYIIEDDAEYARVIATAHDAGMQVLPYFNPGAYTDKDLQNQLALLRTHKEQMCIRDSHSISPRIPSSGSTMNHLTW